jgi:hypothetical protein
MNACKNMKSSLALWVGHDLDESEEREVRRHVAVCESCREYSLELQETQGILEQTVASRVVDADSPSIWPELRATLLQRARRSTSTAAGNSGFWRMQNLLPAGALAAACLTIWFGSNNQLPSEMPTVARPHHTAPSTFSDWPGSQDPGVMPVVGNPEDLMPSSRSRELLRPFPVSRTPAGPDSDR